MTFILSSCHFPNWFVSHRHVTVASSSGSVPEVVHIREIKRAKSRFYINQFFRNETLQQVSEQSFSVLYHGERIQPEVSFLNDSKRLKELTTIPPMTPFCINFKFERQQGDTIQIIEHNVPRQGDSIVVNVEIPEEKETPDVTDFENFFYIQQLYPLSEEASQEDGLYYDLKFENGICVKEFVVNHTFLHRSILNGTLAQGMEQIMRQEDVPQWALSFYYRSFHYYLNISNDCDLTYKKNSIKERSIEKFIKERNDNDSVKIRVKFFENVKQPYYNDVPFGIIEEISPI